MTIARDLANVASLMASSSANVVFDNTVILSGGVSNGVIFLDDSKTARTTSSFVYDSANTRIGINTSTPRASIDINTTDGMIPPSGTTAQRPNVPIEGLLRWNTETKTTEQYTGTKWTPIAGVDKNAISFFFASSF
jgi:hypothetical protein